MIHNLDDGPIDDTVGVMGLARAVALTERNDLEPQGCDGLCVLWMVQNRP